MIRYTCIIEKFDKKGEKTGWSYIPVSAERAGKMKPGYKVSFRVKGKLDDVPIKQTALLPMGDGSFILPVNGQLRKQLKKKAGDKITVHLEADDAKLRLSADFVACLRDDERAYTFFKSLPASHQSYFSKWIESAKTTATKAKRITMAVIALAQGQGYGEMLRANKGKPS